MLKIRAEQTAAMQADSEAAFLRGLFADAEAQFPHLKELPRPQAQRVVESAVLAARAAGCRLEYTIQNYLHLSIAFGAGFLSDPQYPWARKVMDAPDLDEVARSAKLFSLGAKYLERVHGATGDLYRAALGAAGAKGMTLLGTPVGGGGLWQVLQPVYPEKCAVLGEELVGRLADEAVFVAGQRKLSSPASVTLVAVLMFFLGAGCFDDPQYSWLAEALNASPDEAKRSAALARASLAMIAKATAVNPAAGR